MAFKYFPCGSGSFSSFHTLYPQENSSGAPHDRPVAGPPLRQWSSQNGVVRREKALVNSGCKSRPGTGLLHPVAIEAAVEVTKPLEPSM
jgi:hypothetical protein